MLLTIRFLRHDNTQNSISSPSVSFQHEELILIMLQIIIDIVNNAIFLLPGEKYDKKRGAFWSKRFQKAGKDLKIGSNTTIKGAEYISVGNNVTIGNDVFIEIMKNCPLEIGDDVNIDKGAVILSHRIPKNKGITIGNMCRIGINNVVNAGNGLTIGNYVRVGPSVNINNYNHQFRDKNVPIILQGSFGQDTIIEDDCWIGTGAIILGATIGRGSVIGAGSVVTKDIENYSVVAGVPAKFLKKREGIDEN